MILPSAKVISLIAILIFIVFFFIYLIIPKVGYHKSTYGSELLKSNPFSQDVIQEFNTFIADTASRMQHVIALHKGEVVFEYGNTKKLINCHSARKSIMSLLIGIAQDKGFLSIDENLGEIGIDESTSPLTDTEKKATIRDLLMNRSGIYLQAEGEHDFQEDDRPKRGMYLPGEHFFYNNFDFNVLGTILEKKTGMSIGAFMEKYLAEPIGMQDFNAGNVIYGNPWFIRKDKSDHRIFWLYMSARDFARVGLVITNNGVCNNTKIVTNEWMDLCFDEFDLLTDQEQILFRPYKAFSYSWWIEKENNTIWADGYGGQFLCIDRKEDFVLVQRNFTGNSLLSSGLSIMDKNRDNNPKSDLIQLYRRMLDELEVNR